MKQIKLNQLIEIVGSQEKLAKAIGLSQQAISRWVKSGRVPAEHARKVSEATGVPPHIIRPDIFDCPSQEPAE